MSRSQCFTEMMFGARAMTSPGGGGVRRITLPATSLAGGVGGASARALLVASGCGADPSPAALAFDPVALVSTVAAGSDGSGSFARVAEHGSCRSRGFGTISRRHFERGASTPANLVNGYRGGAMMAAKRAMNSSPVITRCLPRLPWLTDFRRYATRPPGRRRSRSSDSGGRAPDLASRSRPTSSPASMRTPT